MSATLRRRWRELALLATSLLLSLLAAEVLLRVHYRATYTGTLDDLSPAQAASPGATTDLGDLIRIAESERLVYRLQPRLDVDYRGVRVRTNDQGWREEAVATRKPDDLIRIVGIGDSVMFGLGVAAEERYLDVLEGALAARHPRARWETVALAAPGYNLVMEVEALRRDGLAYRPDVVLYGYVGNDECLPNYVDTRRDVFAATSFLRLYWKRTLAPATLLRREDLVGAEAGERPERSIFCEPETFPERYRPLVGRAAFEGALEALRALGDEHGFEVWFFNYGRSTVPTDLRIPADIARFDFTGPYWRYLATHGFGGPKSSDLVLGPTNGHPSAKGHAVAAGWLLEELERRGTIRALLARRGFSEAPGPALQGPAT